MNIPYKRPESVLVVIYTAAAEVLLLQRVDVPSFWQSVTGSLDVGETPQIAAQREVAEETGLIADQRLTDCHDSHRFVIQPPWRARYAPEVTHNVEHVFALKLAQPQPIMLNPKEHQAFCWLPKSQALEQTTSYTNRAAILKYV